MQDHRTSYMELFTALIRSFQSLTNSRRTPTWLLWGSSETCAVDQIKIMYFTG